MAVHSNRSAYGPFDDGELVGQKRTDSTAEDAEEPAMSAVKSWNSSCTEKSCAEQHSMLSLRGEESRWMIPRQELQLQKELSRTLKSTLYRASWHGTEVVVKCAGLHDAHAALAMSNTGALKSGSIPEETETMEIAAELLHEIDILSSMRHPDMVMFIGACLDPELPIMCVTEFMPGGDLESYYASQRQKHDSAVWSPRLSTVLDWGSAVARALVFLHSRKMVHRDLKPMNLLLSKHLEVKVSDFGISRMLSLSDAYSMTGGVGSWRYMAPEVVRHQAYDEKVDIYALGLILYFMNSGCAPFHQLGRDPERILIEFQAGKEPRPVVADCSLRLRPLVASAWHVDPGQRPSAEHILEWLGRVSQQTSCGPCRQM
ncbi:unnamed protein product [Symbiodinium sp. CCMP2592]|nr:unnamed protein product [Symbiodinium sp. CCMP2592]